MAGDEPKAEYFLQRRELGLSNVGGEGAVTVDGKKYIVKHENGMYIGMGSRNIRFKSTDVLNPVKYYMHSAPAHKAY